MNLDIVYDVLDASTVGLTFYYAKASETLSVRQEWVNLQRLNNKTGNKLIIPAEVPPDVDRISIHGEYMGYRLVFYRIPALNRRIHVLDIWREGTDILEADTSHSISPVPLYVEPPYYLCMASG